MILRDEDELGTETHFHIQCTGVWKHKISDALVILMDEFRSRRWLSFERDLAVEAVDAISVCQY